VLPLANLSSDPEQEYFADGMTEALIAELAQIGALRVISRTSAMQYKGTHKSLPDIAHELKVDGLIEGSVLRAGERVRITAQLIHAATDTHVWAKSYERDLQDVLALQADVARAIADEIKLKVTRTTHTQPGRKRSVNSEAYEAYLQGRYFWNQRGSGLQKSVEYFERALSKDGTHALAHAGLADAYALLGFYGFLPPREAMPKAKRAALRALELNENLPEAHSSLGYVYTAFDWDWERAEQAFKRARQLNASYSPARYWYSNLLMALGRMEEATAEVRRGLEDDPLSVYMHTHLGIVLVAARNYEQADEPLRKALELDPSFTNARCVLGLVLYFQSHVEESVRELERAVASSARNQWALWMIGMVYAASGNHKRADQTLQELLHRANTEYIQATHVASIYALLNRKDEALAWLETAHEERAPMFAGLEHGCGAWAYDGLRGDPEFRALISRTEVRHAESP
jgi:TolB-like protein/Flp pilus assembly protein TadD